MPRRIAREESNGNCLRTCRVVSCLKAIEKLELYAQRWKVETFHKILRSGCRAQEAKPRTADRLVNLIAILTILSWRIFWITMLTENAPGSRANGGLHGSRSISARRAVPTRFSSADPFTELMASSETRPPRRLPCSCTRPATRKHRHLERFIPIN